ncbi:MAG TPA: methionyl-tRNA formyltransferase [Candidatus Saccharimonadales bacterium]|nr:methionyl-tRNA formyltransferase [Candidatus Saccharimonadales bacterium]
MDSTPEPISIVFFGAGDVAARSLQLLVKDFAIEAVVTKPRPAHHHGPWEVMELAEQLGLPVITAENKTALTAAVQKAAFHSSVGVLIDFGIIVEQAVIDAFPKGIVNSHFSLLPQWRGADPITFSILSGQDKTGVSLMLLVAAMDEGPLLAIGEADIDLNAVTTPELTSNLIGLSGAMLADILPKYVRGEIKTAVQEKVAETVGYSPIPSYSRKLTKEDGILDYHKPATQLAREVRAYLGWPKSRTILGGHAVIITQAHAADGSGEPGRVWQHDRVLGIYCTTGILMVDRLKPAGKQEMSIDAFLNGYGRDLS